MPTNKILIVDDEAGILEVCQGSLRRLPDAEVVVENRSRQAAKRLEQESPDLLIIDLYMPELDGLALLRMARQRDPSLAVLVITAFPTVETAIECMKLGAADYMTKPFLPEDLLANVKRLLEDKQLREENLVLRRQIQRDFAFAAMLGQSESMQKVFHSIQRAADTQFDVLIAGETGTGKELVAHALHQQSRRKAGPFIPVDCGAIPDELVESEFFGHERGAFTGAQTRSLGLLELANRGTFFLDEIAQLPLRLQAKFLRVLQERKIRRVGGAREIDLDLRIIAASSADLAKEVQAQRFRLDLYHRIHVVHIELPPLRERAGDIPLLADHFVRRFAQEMEKGPVELSPEVAEILTCYAWPGNVRELQNVLKQTLAMAARPLISVEDLPEEIVAQAGSGSPKRAGSFFEQRERRIATFEKEYLQRLLVDCQGDISAVAREAQLPRGTLYRLLKKSGLNPADFRPENVPAAVPWKGS